MLGGQKFLDETDFQLKFIFSHTMSEFHKRSLSQSHINLRVIKVQDTSNSTDKLNSQSSDNCIYSMVKKSSSNNMIKNPKSFSSYSSHKRSHASCDFEDIEEDSECKHLDMISGDIVLSGSVKYTPVNSPPPSSCNNKSAFNFSPDTSSSEQTPKLVREKAKEYRKIRGKNLFSTIEESSSKDMLSNSITDANIVLPPPPILPVVNSDLSIQKVIIVQSVMRRHLTMKRIKEKEEFRVRYRTILERNCEKTYKIKIDKIEDQLRNGLKCREYEEAVEQVKEYVNDILQDPMDVSDYKTKIQYLFSLCDEKQQGCLEEEQFLVLTEQIMKLKVPKSSYEHLFNEENKVYCDFERFYRWFNRILILLIFIIYLFFLLK